MMQNVQLMSGYRQPDQLNQIATMAMNQYGSSYGVMPGGYSRGPGGYHQMSAYSQVPLYFYPLPYQFLGEVQSINILFFIRKKSYELILVSRLLYFPVHASV